MPWERPPKRPDLSTDEVHVWRFVLQPTPLDTTPLSAAERRRGERFRSPVHRERYLASRAILRSTLSRYLDVAPSDVPIEVRDSGKPYVPRTNLEFNLSHSGDLAVMAISQTRPVGVDVERMRRTIGYQRLARRFFSDREIAVLEAMPGSVRSAAFFRIWTRKEAYLKATDVDLGPGLPSSLARFTVAGMRHGTIASVEVPAYPDERDRWVLIDIDVAPGHVGALAVKGRPRVRLFDDGAGRS